MVHGDHGSAWNGKWFTPGGTQLDLVRAEADELACEILPAAQQNSVRSRSPRGRQANRGEADMVELTKRERRRLSARLENQSALAIRAELTLYALTGWKDTLIGVDKPE